MMNLGRRLEQLEICVANRSIDRPAADDSGSSRISPWQARDARVRFAASVKLTRQEAVAWRCFWETAAQMIRPDEWEAEMALIRAAGLTAGELWALAHETTGKYPSELQELVEGAVTKLATAWAGLDDPTRALVELKHKKEREAITEIGRWTEQIDVSKGPVAFRRAMGKITRALAGLDEEALAILDLRGPYAWLALGMAGR